MNETKLTANFTEEQLKGLGADYLQVRTHVYSCSFFLLHVELHFRRESRFGVVVNHHLRLQALKKTPEGLYVVSTHYPELFPLLQRAEEEDTRKTMERLANSKCKGVNEEILAEILILRHEAAVLMGYASDAAVQLSQKMAGKPETVDAFLRDMAQGLEGKARCDQRKSVLSSSIYLKQKLY